LLFGRAAIRLRRQALRNGCIPCRTHSVFGMSEIQVGGSLWSSRRVHALFCAAVCRSAPGLRMRARMEELPALGVSDGSFVCGLLRPLRGSIKGAHRCAAAAVSGFLFAI